MQEKRRIYSGTTVYRVMRFLGSTARSIQESAYYFFPFMKPQKREEKIQYRWPWQKKIVRELSRSSGSETAAAPVQKDLSVEEPVKEIVPDVSTFFKSIEFKSDLERVEAEIFVKDFQSPLKKTRIKALEQFKKFSKRAIILKELLSLEKDSLRIIEIINSLSTLKDKDKVQKQIFTNFLKHPNLALREAAIRALSKYKDEESFSILSSCLNDENAEVRRQALSSLSWTFGNRCSSAALKLLHDINKHVRKTAILTCGTLKLYQAVPSLITLFSDPDKKIQKNVAMSLRKITGQNFGFLSVASTGSKNNQDAAIEKWLAWWRRNQTKFEK